MNTPTYLYCFEIGAYHVAVPTTSEFANAKVVRSESTPERIRIMYWSKDYQTTYNGYVKHGDFRTEVSEYVLDTAEDTGTMYIRDDKYFSDLQDLRASHGLLRAK